MLARQSKRHGERACSSLSTIRMLASDAYMHAGIAFAPRSDTTSRAAARATEPYQKALRLQKSTESEDREAIESALTAKNVASRRRIRLSSCVRVSLLCCGIEFVSVGPMALSLRFQDRKKTTHSKLKGGTYQSKSRPSVEMRHTAPTMTCRATMTR